jgi:hypothetical protein
MMSKPIEPPRKDPLASDEELATLIHDIRHCLYVLRTGLGLLKAKCQEKQLSELCDAMAEEERNAARLLEELLAAVGERLERSSG